MPGLLALILHAHLPFVRHPEHPSFLEENWLFEAITETYLPLLQVLEGWETDQVPARLTLTLTPTLCSMLRDDVLRERYERHLDRLFELVELEVRRTLWEKPLHQLAVFYRDRLESLRQTYVDHDCDLVAAFRRLQDIGRLEIITCAATHAVLPLLAGHPPALRAQLGVGCDHYRECFGRDPAGIWLPECGYDPEIEAALQAAGLRWFVTEAHGVLRARPKPRFAVFAPVLTTGGLAAFGRDPDSARQVWSRNEGYPGDPRYRDFYRDIGFDLELEYLRPYLPVPDLRAFTGLKYHRITGPAGAKEIYDRTHAMSAVAAHAAHFLTSRAKHIASLAEVMEQPPIIVAPYDAELFGHWWYEGPEFLDQIARQLQSPEMASSLRMITPGDYLKSQPTLQRAAPAASSWGEEGHWQVWLNEKNHWMLGHLQIAQERMTALVMQFASPTPLEQRALSQAGRELLLAQSSDWPFIVRTGTSPEYARRRFQEHLLRFDRLRTQLQAGQISEPELLELESRDNLFPKLNIEYWSSRP